MKPSEHVAYGAAASAALSPFFGFSTLFFFLGSVFIDLDHYVDYVYFGRFKKWTVRGMLRFHGELAKAHKVPHLLALEAFHTAEFLLLFLAVGLYFKSEPVLLAFAGMIFHLALDLIRLGQGKIIHVRALSFTEYILRAGKMKRNGLDPEAPFRQAYEKSVQKA